VKSGTCPNCGSSEVYAGAKVGLKAGVYGSNTIPISFWYSGILDNYVCVDCGYVESYISDRARLEEVRKKWVKVK
jgi:predicted RNA-binding Zn-ribbon protein involved in translation (DUF1610 family)